MSYLWGIETYYALAGNTDSHRQIGNIITCGEDMTITAFYKRTEIGAEHLAQADAAGQHEIGFGLTHPLCRKMAQRLSKLMPGF